MATLVSPTSSFHMQPHCHIFLARTLGSPRGPELAVAEAPIDLGDSWCGCGLAEVRVCIGCGLTRNRINSESDPETKRMLGKICGDVLEVSVRQRPDGRWQIQ